MKFTEIKTVPKECVTIHMAKQLKTLDIIIDSLIIYDETTGKLYRCDKYENYTGCCIRIPSCTSTLYICLQRGYIKSYVPHHYSVGKQKTEWFVRIFYSDANYIDVFAKTYESACRKAVANVIKHIKIIKK